MHVNQKMMYMGFGCLLTLVGYILASIGNDSVAQSGSEDVTFSIITCHGLEVVDEEGIREFFSVPMSRPAMWSSMARTVARSSCMAAWLAGRWLFTTRAAKTCFS